MKLGQKVLGKKLFGLIMKQTFYGHFVAGEDQERIKPSINRMHQFGVKSILDYSVEEDMPEEKDETPTKPLKKDAKGVKQYQKMDEKANSVLGRTHKVNSARVHFYAGEAQCDKNMEIILSCIDAVTDSTGGTGFAALKITALGRPELLLILSDCLERTRRYYQQMTGKKGFVLRGHTNKAVLRDVFKDSNIDENENVQNFLEQIVADDAGVIHLFNWSSIIDGGKGLGDVFQVPNLKTGVMEPLISGDDDGALTLDEERQFQNMLKRLHTIFKYAKERNVRVMVDAEQSYFQPAIHRITIEMMRTYNKDKAIVFNTYQNYLRKSYNTICADLDQAQRQNFYFGAKLVRGAYMEQERARAALLEYKDPINIDKDATDAMYHKVLDECLNRIYKLKEDGKDPQRVGILVATHNEDTIRHAIRKMAELEIDPSERALCFGQLLGMCDQMSFPLGQSGYSVYKYVPYGPVNEVLPYLSRRANENGSLMEKLKKEKSLLRKELFSRIIRGQWFYKPTGDYKPVGFK
jgi:proline dehydrogenase